MYKYDSKNRPLNVTQPASDIYNTPEPTPAILPDETVKDPPLQHTLAVDTGIPLRPIPHSSPMSGTNLRIVQKDQATATTDTGMDFCQCVYNGKSKKLVTGLVASSSLLSSLIVIGAYLDATSLVDLIQTKNEHSKILRLFPGYLKVLRDSLATGRSVIEAQYKQESKRLGKEYAGGDSRAREQMGSILISFQSTVLSKLQWVKNQPTPFYDYQVLQYASEDYRAKASVCLRALSLRLSEVAVATETDVLLEQNMPCSTEPDWVPEKPAYSDSWPAVASISFRYRGHSNSAYESRPDDGSASPTVSAMFTVNADPEDGGMSDIDMDRFSAMSLAPSSLSGFSSLKSLSRRIRKRQMAHSSSDEPSPDDLPSNAMEWNRSSGSSFELFGQLSSRLSVDSSQKTDSSRMSWKPEIATTIEEDDGVPAERLPARSRRPNNPSSVRPRRRRRLP